MWEVTLGNILAHGIEIIVVFWRYTWWVWLLWVSAASFRSLWQYWLLNEYAMTVPWTVVEIKIPREVQQTPRAMDQVLQSIAVMKRGMRTFRKRFLKGTINPRFSFEMVSFGGDIHFYIRSASFHTELIKAAFYAYYPDVEIVEVNDYVDQLPQNATDLEIANMDMRGFEKILKRSPIYQPLSYKDFETPNEDDQFDVMSVFMEALGKVSKDTFVGIQYVCDPLGYGWSKAYKDEVAKLREPKFAQDAITTQFGEYKPQLFRSPGETAVLERVERTISQAAFSAFTRIVYLAPKPTFIDEFGARKLEKLFDQVASDDLNYFITNYKSLTALSKDRSGPVMIKSRRKIRKTHMLQSYIERDDGTGFFWGLVFKMHPLFIGWNAFKESILTTETLATLFHPPTRVVTTAPHTERVESRKAPAPAGLPIYPEGDPLSHFER